jgi:diguanylate cyclase (GGDEF)-like protein
MNSASSDETTRISALATTRLLETPDNYAFDCAANIGAQLFNVAFCTLVLVGSEPAASSPDVDLTGDEMWSAQRFCRCVVESDETLVIQSNAVDAGFGQSAFVHEASRIKFYAGYPIHAANGAVLGTLCLINFEPIEFGYTQLQLLRELAFLTELSLCARRIGTAQKALIAKLDVARRESLVDPMLRIWNRGGITSILDQLHETSVERHATFSICMIDIDRFKRVNDQCGHIAGDSVLKDVSRVLQAGLRPDDELGRYGGEEFIAILPDTNTLSAERLAIRLNKAVAELRAGTSTVPIRCTVSIGIAERAPHQFETVQSLIHRADSALLLAKQSGRNRVVVGQQAGSMPIARHRS